MSKRKRIYRMSLIVLAVLIIGNIWALYTDYKTTKENKKYGIHSYIKSVNEQSITVILECSGVDTEDYLYVDTGPWHEIEKRTLFGWVKLRCLQDSWSVGTVSKYDITEKDEAYELEFFYQWYYGDLRRGTYRVTNPIKTEKNGKEEVVGFFYTTFQISKGAKE